MPSVSSKQHRLMATACYSRHNLKSDGPSKKVACEFMQADKRSGKFRKKKKS